MKDLLYIIFSSFDQLLPSLKFEVDLELFQNAPK